ncbi:SPX domain-containing protein 2 [Auxenochlorella protothecoides]|uniref:SPX domain-containing protein 2 n=1 Tax=Auxenochlorella protothecoides TaxID=3075 RepID=A0A087SNF8_AUXPR|nr:SPX domain-containing protein 2 [Auxenochlorella protothecoides]KFM27262.1 SPX domain-containing protein 2 [Auxenochlorella protothecoides]
MTTPEVTDAEIPKALLKRLIKAKLSTVAGADPTRDYQIHKDALLAFQEAAKIFIHYLTATANDVCRDARRQTISAEDVLTALNDLDFGEVTGELTEALEDFRTEAREKSKKKAEGKKRKAEATFLSSGGMKFAAALRNSAEELPDAAELFTLYKHLKKSLKRIPCGDAGHDDSSLVADPASEFGEAASGDEDEADTALELPSLDASAATLADSAQDAAAALDEGERAFVAELTRDVEQLNEQYMEKEEVNVIRFGTLKDQAAAARSRQELQRAYRAVVDFHGELLLVLHWSILAYTGLVKILKKHHKRTGLLLRAPHLTNMLGQPFCSVEAEGPTSVADAEVHHGSSLSADSHVCGSSAGGLAAPGDGPGCHTEPRHKRRREPARMGEGAMSEGSAGGGAAGGEDAVTKPVPQGSGSTTATATATATTTGAPSARPTAGSSVLRRTRAALGLWRQLQVTASTPSTVLPPGAGLDARRALSVGAAPAGSGLTNSSAA